MTLVGDPRVIFLDEPTTGLDPRSRRTMWQIVRELVADGVTVFLTTQYLEEADQLADRIARARPRPAGRRGHRRRAQAAASPAATSGCASPTRRALDAAAPRCPRRHPRRRRARPAGAQRRQLGALRALLDRLDDAAIDVDELTVHTPDLDDVFLALTGHAADRHDRRRPAR